MVARREQGAVGNVSRGEWGNSKTKKVITNSRVATVNVFAFWPNAPHIPLSTRGVLGAHNVCARHARANQTHLCDFAILKNVFILWIHFTFRLEIKNTKLKTNFHELMTSFAEGEQ